MTDIMKDDFATVLNKYRLKKGISMNKLAPMVGVSVPTISRSEKGKQPFPQDKVDALIEALGLTGEDAVEMRIAAYRGKAYIYIEARPYIDYLESALFRLVPILRKTSIRMQQQGIELPEGLLETIDAFS